MKIARDLKATDLRDTVFAFFGLAKSNYDYGKTLREVYIDATRSFIQNSDRNDEFWWLTGDCEELLSSEFPSWVRDPRLRARKTPSISPMTDKTQHSTECYSAAGLDRCSLRANISFSMNGDVLGVSGLHVDEVIVVGDAFGLEDNTALATLDSWRDIAIPKEEEIVDHVSFCVRNEAFWRTVLTDQPLYEYQPNNYGMEEIHRLGRSTTADPTICHLSCSTVTPYAIIAALPRIRWKRRFFMTSKGFMGLGPYNARVGDHVYVLFGVDVPFVLRRMESKGDFKIIGDWLVFIPKP
ncbi:hypothetical protein HYFRA_00009517 [Hymenoscyphus fraxineus]|uniref:Heterokaryon incompatibility domain-containing protein n=1 Tax=Hymenoscyphus fraxineus TaxID=746836 RepID=A0A9N9KZF7_9HELO|nr:hypothetical protein HYFRA_00009517 [Hymenoscyphus fraxineus]